MTIRNWWCLLLIYYCWELRLSSAHWGSPGGNKSIAQNTDKKKKDSLLQWGMDASNCAFGLFPATVLMHVSTHIKTEDTFIHPCTVCQLGAFFLSYHFYWNIYIAQMQHVKPMYRFLCPLLEFLPLLSNIEPAKGSGLFLTTCATAQNMILTAFLQSKILWFLRSWLSMDMI